MVQAVMRAMGSDGGWQRKLRSLPRRSPPAVRLGSSQAADCYRSAAQGLGTPALGDGDGPLNLASEWSAGLDNIRGKSYCCFRKREGDV